MKSAAASASPPIFPSRRHRLAYHLTVVLTVKVILLAALWNTFIKPNKVEIDADAMGGRIAGAVSTASIPISSGDNK